HHLHRRVPANRGIDMTVAAIQIAGLTSGYGEAMVLRDVSLTLLPGEVLAVLGKNGMGKSTLLNTIMGFVPARSGSIRLFVPETKGMPPHRRAALSVSYSPQDQPIFQDLTVEENLRLGLRSDRDFAPAFEHVSGFFPVLAQRRRQAAGTLSGGEQKMLIIARALLSRPRLMLVDEIAEGLQPSIILRLIEVLRAHSIDRTKCAVRAFHRQSLRRARGRRDSRFRTQFGTGH